MAVEQDVKVIIKGEDKTGDSFRAVGLKLKGLNTDVSGLAKTLAGGVIAGGVALTAFLYETAKAASEAEIQMARVDTTLKNMGEAALKNKDAILQAADAAVRLGFDDEDAAESISRLYQRTNDLTEAMSLSSLAMDLSRAKNIELSDATNLVGQVLSGNARLLKQYGIELNDTLTPMQALDELQRQVGGNANAFAQTFQGQMQILSIEFQNLKETLGSALLEAIMPFIKQLTDWAAKPDTQNKIKEISVSMREWAEVVIPVVIGVFKLWADILKFIIALLLEIGKIIMETVASFEKLARAAAKAGGTVGGGIKSAASSVANFVSAPFRAEGGPVMGGSPYIVGEKGPELFVPSSFGNIVSNAAMRGSGSGSITINISGNQLLDQSAGEKIASQVMSALRSNLRI